MENTHMVAAQKYAPVKRSFRSRALYSLLKTASYVFTRRLHFRRDCIGEIIISDDNREYSIFRQVFVSPGQARPKQPGAVLRIRFNFAHGSSRQNKLLSLIPIPFIAGLPGFRSKTWAIQKDTGGFQGIYEWDSAQDAENYKKSFAIKLMTKRAVPGSVSFRINPEKIS